MPMLTKLFAYTLALALLTGCAAETDQPAPSDRLTVTASIPPIEYLVDRIGGEAVTSQVLLGPGRSPATYEPTPTQMMRLGDGKLFILAGVPYEQSLRTRIPEMFPDLPLLDLGEPGSDDHNHTGLDPHYWLDPISMLRRADLVVEQLVELDPGNQHHYRSNYDSLAHELESLDQRLRAIFSTTAHRRFYCYHPAYGWLAQRYGLEQIAIEHEGKEPSPARLTKLIDRARADSVRTIFVQQQFAQTSARAVAEAIGARLYILDPLSENYVDNLESLARAIAVELSADTTKTSVTGE